MEYNFEKIQNKEDCQLIHKLLQKGINKEVKINAFELFLENNTENILDNILQKKYADYFSTLEN